MKKITYKEPAFLRDIHYNQISNYEKTKSLTTQERIAQLAKEAHQNLEKLGLRIIQFSHK